MLADFLLASAYLIGFKNEKLHGQTYIDGGMINNVPTNSLIKRGYENIIQIRIYGPGVKVRVKKTEKTVIHEIAPTVKLGNIIEFEKKRSRQIFFCSIWAGTGIGVPMLISATSSMSPSPLPRI